MRERTRNGTLDGRAVELRLAGIGAALDANDLREKGQNYLAGFVVLCASAHWADTGERIFATPEAVRAWPMIDMNEVLLLATMASELNQPRQIADPTATEGLATNGTGEALPSS